MSKNTSTTFVYLFIALFSVVFISGKIGTISIGGQTANISDSISDPLPMEGAVDYSSDDRVITNSVSTDLSLVDLSQSISENNVDIEAVEVETDPDLGASEYVQVDLEQVDSGTTQESVESQESLPEEETEPAQEQQEAQVPPSINIHTFDIAEESVDMFLSKRQKIRTFNLGGNVYIYFLTLMPSKINLNIKDAEGDINNISENKQIFGSDAYSLSHFIKIENSYLSKEGSNQITIKAVTPDSKTYSQVIFFDHSKY